MRTATLRLPTGSFNGYARTMVISERQILDALSRMLFAESAEMAAS